jgi:hypothetical protein
VICAAERGWNERGSPDDLAATVAERLCGNHEHVYVALIRHLAAGQPVSAAHLAEDIAMEEPAVSAVLQEMSDVAYDGDGQAVGFGFSLVPTAHQFTINCHGRNPERRETSHMECRFRQSDDATSGRACRLPAGHITS